MAETWSASALQSGWWEGARWDGWRTDFGQIVVDEDRFSGGARWQVDVPAGSNIVSATFSAPANSYTQADFDLIVFDEIDASPLKARYESPLGPQVVASAVDNAYAVDVAGLIQHIVDKPGWAANNHIAFRMERKGGSGSNDFLIRNPLFLEVVWLDPVQEVASETVTGRFRVGSPVGVEYSLRPVPLTIVGHVGSPDVQAPRTLTAEPVRVTPSVGGTVTSGTGPGPEATQTDTLTITGTVNVALLSITVAPTPPPPPWRRLVVSQEYADALASREPATDARVEIIDKNDAVIATLGGTDSTHPGVVAGSVTCTGDDPIRWTCDLTIDNPDLLPTAVGDLLHPLSHNRVRIWWMIRLNDYTWGEVPVGTYYLDWPSVTDDGEAAVGMSAQGSDAVAELKRNTWDTLLDVAGMEASEAIRQIIEDRAPWAQVAITPSDHRLPDEWEAGEPGGDPVDDIEAIANAAGMIFHADRMGVLTLTDRPTMLGATAARFMEGPDAAITSISADIDLDEVLNRVTVASSGRLEDSDGEELPPIVAVAEDDDPTSPLWVGLDHIYHHRVESDQIATQAQAERMARDLLDGARSLVDQVELVVFAHPHLDPGEVIEVNAERAGVSGHRQIDDWSLALGDLSGQRITSSGRRGLT